MPPRPHDPLDEALLADLEHQSRALAEVLAKLRLTRVALVPPPEARGWSGRAQQAERSVIVDIETQVELTTQTVDRALQHTTTAIITVADQ